ncbi:MAG TPA: hypothetical protein VFH28_06510 [Nitrososphaera sp.]|nr:hypothetical protein [Nitrososphaera sp.]
MIITDTSAAHNGDGDAAASQCMEKYLSFNPGQILPEWATMYYSGTRPHIMVNTLLILPSLWCT